MAIIVNGYEHRTLAQPLYVNGKQVMEAYANGVKVYPEGQAFVVKFGAVDSQTGSKAVFIVTSDTHIYYTNQWQTGNTNYGFQTFPDDLRTFDEVEAYLDERGWSGGYTEMAAARGTWDIYGTVKLGSAVREGFRRYNRYTYEWWEYYATPETISIMNKVNGKTLLVGQGDLDSGGSIHGCEVEVGCDFDGYVYVANRFSKPVSGMEGVARLVGAEDGVSRSDRFATRFIGPSKGISFSLPKLMYYSAKGRGRKDDDWVHGDVAPFVSDDIVWPEYSTSHAQFVLTKVLYSNSPYSYSHEPTEVAPPSAYVVSESDFSSF